MWVCNHSKTQSKRKQSNWPTSKKHKIRSGETYDMAEDSQSLGLLTKQENR